MYGSGNTYNKGDSAFCGSGLFYALYPPCSDITVGVNAILAVTTYHQGYKTAYCSFVGTLISGAFASVIHFLFCLLFSFEAFCAGGVKFISALLKFGASLSSDSFDGTLERADCIAVFFINAAICCAVMAISKKCGAAKRMSDRVKMTGSAEPAQAVTEE